MKEMITGAQIVFETLERMGIKDIFGYPGGAVIPLYDALYDVKGIRHYFARHEQGAAHEADGYARSTGRVGCCIATSGPGATNLVTGIMTAYMDSVPLLVITGQVGSHLIGKDAFQESDIVGITLPITKNNYLIKDLKDLPYVLKEAYYLASTGRPGPVLVDIPRNIQLQEMKRSDYERLFNEPVHIEGYEPTYKGHGRQIKRAVTLLKEAKKPLIIAGAGILRGNAVEELYELAKKIDAPVTNTLLGLGSYPGDEDAALGMLGMHGTVAANYATDEADVVLAVGIRFDDRIAGNPDLFCKNAQIIHVDIDPAEIGKNKLVDVPIVGDVKRVLSAFNEQIKENYRHDEWRATYEGWKKEYPICYQESDREDKVMPQYVLTLLNEIVKGEAIIVTDVGQHQMWSAQYLTHKYPHSFLSSGGAGTMGFGLPAAIGAQVGNPHKKVILVVGDGGFQMTAHEMMLLTEYKLPVKVLILNNSYLGMVRQWQEIFHDRRYSYVDLEYNPDFVMLANAYGVKGVSLSTKKAVKESLRELIESDEPVLINCVVEKEENVLPMITPGGSVADMVGKRGVL